MTTYSKHTLTPTFTSITYPSAPLNVSLQTKMSVYPWELPNSDSCVSRESGLLPNDLCVLSSSAPAIHTAGPATSGTCIFAAVTVSPDLSVAYADQVNTPK